jgi:hypothetical protein
VAAGPNFDVAVTGVSVLSRGTASGVPGCPEKIWQESSIARISTVNSDFRSIRSSPGSKILLFYFYIKTLERASYFGRK